MKCLIILLASFFSIAFTSGKAVASEYKAKSVIKFSTSFFSSTPSKEIQQEAFNKARRNAWNEYTSTFNSSKMKSYKEIEQSFLANLDNYITDTTLLAEKVDKENQTYVVMVRIKINEAAVNAKLTSESAAGQMSSGEGSFFSFIFVARQASEVKLFEDKITKISRTESSNMAKEKSAAASGSMIAADSQKSMTKVQQGGSTEKKSDKIKYNVSSPQDINAAMNEILTPAGFEVVEYADVVNECGGAEPGQIMNEFVSSANLSRLTRKAAIAGARNCEVKYFAIGTLDIGMQDTDSVSGLKRVYVTVNAQVWDISRRLPKKVASVNSHPSAGLGPDSVVAQRNALKKASSDTASIIVDQLNAKNLR